MNDLEFIFLAFIRAKRMAIYIGDAAWNGMARLWQLVS